MSHGGNGPGSPHLRLDVFENGFLLLGLEFVGNGPTRSLGSRTCIDLHGEGIELNHRTVCRVFVFMPKQVELLDGRPRIFSRFHQPTIFDRGQIPVEYGVVEIALSSKQVLWFARTQTI